MYPLNSLRRSGHKQVVLKGPQSLIPLLRLTAHSTFDTQTGIYRLTADASTWTRIVPDIPTAGGYMSMTEYNETLYIVSDDEIFASSDDGETWNAFCPRPEGNYHVGLIITEAPQITPSRTGIAMYLAFRDEGIFRSTDAGTRWDSFNEGLSGKRIRAMVEIGKRGICWYKRGHSTVSVQSGGSRCRWKSSKLPRSFETEAFADTDSGFYRLNAERWEKVPGAILQCYPFPESL